MCVTLDDGGKIHLVNYGDLLTDLLFAVRIFMSLRIKMDAKEES
ncbi:hypothetical protein X975_03196, partial [Stegodyphus mimosarum]